MENEEKRIKLFDSREVKMAELAIRASGMFNAANQPRGFLRRLY